MNEGFTKRIADRVLSGPNGAPTGAAVIGLDPRPQALPSRIANGQSAALGTAAPVVDRIVAFYREALPRIADHAVAVKPNIAFFESFGAAGYGAYEVVCAAARALDIPVIGDIKRGDIGSTAQAYAEEHFRHADAVTLHPYLGQDSIQPFLDEGAKDGRGVFVLVRTSNPSAVELQEQRLEGGMTLSESVASAVDRWGQESRDAHGYSSVGAVVGATYPDQIQALRRRMPHAWLLIPGVGAQGGAASDLEPAFDQQGLGALVNQSRGVMQCFAPDDADWLDQIEQAARNFAEELRVVAARPAEHDDNPIHQP